MTWGLEDFQYRHSDAAAVAKLGTESNNPSTASALAKSACVLSAAALERYLNDVMEIYAKTYQVEHWDELTHGQSRYLAGQIAFDLSQANEVILTKRELLPSQITKWKRRVERAYRGLECPRTWENLDRFGMFAENVNAVSKVDALLKKFDPQGRSVVAFIAEEGGDVSTIFRAVESVVSARHEAAHALPDSDPPSPIDVEPWLVLIEEFARGIDRFVETGLGASP